MPNGNAKPSFLVLDTETIPDGELLAKVKYSADDLSPVDAIARAQEEARQASKTGSDFVNVAFHVPVAVCVVKVASDFTLQAITCLDGPQFRPKEIVRKFWLGVGMYEQAKLVTFNGRSFDMPMLEVAAFRWGLSLRDYIQRSRNRFQGNHIDLCDWFNNFGACRLMGGLNLFAKMLGKPGKMDIAGDQVYRMHCDGKSQEINDYCLFDTLDTFFVFLRTRVLTGDLAMEQEQELVEAARAFLQEKITEFPALAQYLQSWQT